MSYTLYPILKKNEKYISIPAPTNTGLSTAGLDMSSDEHRVSRSAYVAVLSKDEKSPLAPESDEEKPKDEKKAEQDKEKSKDQSKDKDKDKDKNKDKDKGKASDKAATDKEKDKDSKDDKDKDKEKERKEEPVVVKIDLDGISQRILSLPIPAKNYVNMLPGKSGILFLAEAPLVITDDDQPNVNQTIQKFDLSKRKVHKFLEEVNDYAISFDSDKILYRNGEHGATASTTEV